MNETINRLYNAFQRRRSQQKQSPIPGRVAPLNRTVMTQIRDDIINLSVEIKDTYPHFSSELFTLKDTLFIQNMGLQGYFFSPETFSETFAILKALKYNIDNGKQQIFDFWAFIHPQIINVS